MDVIDKKRIFFLASVIKNVLDTTATCNNVSYHVCGTRPTFVHVKGTLKIF